MNIPLLLQTIVHLKPRQVVYQVWYRCHRPAWQHVEAPACQPLTGLAAPIVKYRCCEGETMTFLGIADRFSSWNQTDHGMLWAYNLNYMDWLGQEGMCVGEGISWIDRFIAELPDHKVGLDPYPIALRSINWMKFLSLHPECATKPRKDALYSQVRLLERKLEYHLLGNHLLEDAYALYIAALFFRDRRLYCRSSKLLGQQLEEQILPDGAHYEQSPMYHCILLDRLLDCLNFSLCQQAFDGQDAFDAVLKDKARKMIGHLKAITLQDGTIPLLNDAAYGIAPTPQQLFDYAARLGIDSQPLPLRECGYRKMATAALEAVVDVGNITATYQPGHTHADTLHYILYRDGRPFAVDTGISTYDKTPRRQYERSTAAHNTVGVGDGDAIRVWGGFRVGRRCRVTRVKDTPTEVIAFHDGYGKPCRRRFTMADGALTVEDTFDGEAVSYLHLAADASVDNIKIEGAYKIETEIMNYAVAYNRLMDGKVLKMHFRGTMKYTIQ